ncbi:MAG: phospholipase D-like domain-containing protein [Deltaproteobacteria bacterium]|nr:phospholipase D-like domain-containing protein [Deltaproteobacteria bacterium]
MIAIIKSPWEETFIDLLKHSRKNIYLASPFIKKNTAKIVIKHSRKSVDLRCMTSFKLANFSRAASDLDALKILSHRTARQKNVHNLHAKFFVFDEVAIVTSGNLTPGGLRNNLEYGLLVDGSTAKSIKKDYLEIFNNPNNPSITKTVIEKADEILLSIPKEKKKTVQIRDSALFEDFMNDENMEERFDAGKDIIRRNLSSWKKDVFDCLTEVPKDIFSIDDIYSFSTRLKMLHPKNMNIKPKIRQQLQYLRNIGLLEFVKPGLYKKLWS